MSRLSGSLAVSPFSRTALPGHAGRAGGRWPIAEVDCGQLPSDSLSMPSIGTLSFFCWDGQIDGGMPARGALANPAATRLLYLPAARQ